MQWVVLHRKNPNAKAKDFLDTQFEHQNAMDIIDVFKNYVHGTPLPPESKLYGLQIAAGNHIYAAKRMAQNALPDNKKIWAQNVRIFYNVTGEEQLKVCVVSCLCSLLGCCLSRRSFSGKYIMCVAKKFPHRLPCHWVPWSKWKLFSVCCVIDCCIQVLVVHTTK